MSSNNVNIDQFFYYYAIGILEVNDELNRDDDLTWYDICLWKEKIVLH